MDGDPIELGAQLFLSATDSLDSIELVSRDTDNEFVFQILLNLLMGGLNAIQRNFNDLTDQELFEFVNNRFAFIGFKMKTEVVSDDFIHYCTIRSGNNPFLLNKFHPFNLMKNMDQPPPAYIKFFSDVDYLHQVLACIKINQGWLVLCFHPTAQQ